MIFRVETDVQIDESHRFVELVPPGSACTVALTSGYVDAEPGALQGVQLNVEDADAAHAYLREHGVQVSDVAEYPWGRFCFFEDLDGNGWSVYEVQVELGTRRGLPRVPRKLRPRRLARR